jgi:hypothetical protein
VPPADVVDREEECLRLVRLAAGGHYASLYAPRRYGKTSLLRKALAEAEQEHGMVTVLVDLYGVLSLADITIRFERAYARLQGPVRRTVEAILRTTGLGLSLGAHGIGVTFQVEPRTNPLPAIHTLLDLPLRVAEKRQARVFVALDEFQDVLRVEDFDGLLRSHIQHQGEVASYVFSGSEPGLMRELFETKTRPLYGQAEPIRLGPLADADIAAYVEKRFRATKRSTGDVLGALLGFARGHPQRSMLLAYRLWEETPRGATADDETWIRALARTRAQTSAEFEARWKGLDPNEQRALRAIALFPRVPYGAAALAAVGLKKSSANYATGTLLARAELDERDGRVGFVDPLLEAWVRDTQSGEISYDMPEDEP